MIFRLFPEQQYDIHAHADQATQRIASSVGEIAESGQVSVAAPIVLTKPPQPRE
ncbi:hypothetical protein [Candidatus Accumulibacter vicinus]|uniref:hypothetical protein n=1 Tax=Candidatus Accumulibacter vicinus TaxID=2954382 RepID=UPI0004AED4F2|nr:hypothetical protein [Candidatus Accumulibacter vicinus]